MNIYEYSSLILNGNSLNDKLTSSSIVDDFSNSSYLKKVQNLEKPTRNNKISFNKKKVKFPKLNTMHQDLPKAKALHFFANHELLAIEIMAAAISLPMNKTKEQELKIKKQLLNTISEEQKHLSLYLKKINSLGIEFGDFSINDFFWKQFKKTKSIEQCFAMVSLCFEQANLDFAKYYFDFFSKIEDLEVAQIFQTVLKDEITHVGIGYFWLNKWKGHSSMEQYFLSLLPTNVTPARAKGITFYEEARRLANFDVSFINFIKNYRDDFLVTQRKQWKK